MREIKFRVWDKNAKMMKDDLDFELESINSLIELSAETDDYLIMQYTGLKDKNDVEIYEGDIVKRCTVVHQGGVKEYSIGRVYYQTPCFVVSAKFEYSDNTFVPLANPHCINQSSDEIIGNIYENKELLNV